MSAPRAPASTPEEHLLLEACAPSPDPGRLDGLVDRVDWAHAWELFSRHHVLPLLPALAGRPGARPPAELRESLRQHRRRHACIDLASRHQLARILSACAADSIEVVVLKGFTLAERFYADPSDRIASDIDLLVPLRARAAFGGLLERLGFRAVERARYEATHFHVPYVARDPFGTVVELHWGLTLDGSEVRFDVDRFWARRRPLELRAGSAFALAPADAFVHLCWHGFNHGTAPLRDLTDIARLARTLDEGDWRDVERIARASGALAFVALALRLVDELWGETGHAPSLGDVDTGWAGRSLLTARGSVVAGDRLWWPLRSIAYWSLLPPGRDGWSSLSRRVVREAASPLGGLRAVGATLAALVCCATMREPWRVGLDAARAGG